MLRHLAHKKRFLKSMQIALTFASVIAVADATRPGTAYDLRTTHAVADFAGEDRKQDRRFNDLARSERKRREAAQRSCRVRRVSRTPEGSRSKPATLDRAHLSAATAVAP